jgi:hypothetical protein
VTTWHRGAWWSEARDGEWWRWDHPDSTWRRAMSLHFRSLKGLAVLVTGLLVAMVNVEVTAVASLWFDVPLLHRAPPFSHPGGFHSYIGGIPIRDTPAIDVGLGVLAVGLFFLSVAWVMRARDNQDRLPPAATSQASFLGVEMLPRDAIWCRRLFVAGIALGILATDVGLEVVGVIAAMTDIGFQVLAIAVLWRVTLTQGRRAATLAVP